MSNHDFRAEEIPDERLGVMSAYRWAQDPKMILFMLARYKFVAKMLAGYSKVLEVGCADGFGSRIVRQAVGSLTALDIDGQMIEDAKVKASPKWDILFLDGDMSILKPDGFEALYCLDVLEHVLPSEEDAFMSQAQGLAPVAIIGMPSLESQPYASPFSRENHVNCKTEEQLRDLMQKYYKRVFIFGMSDEVVHTGFGPMCQYRFALGVN